MVPAESRCDTPWTGVAGWVTAVAGPDALDPTPGDAFGGASGVPLECGLAHDGFKAPEGREIFGRSPGDEPGAVGVAPELERQGPQYRAGEAFEEVEREPCEVGAAGHQEQTGGAGSHDGAHARVRPSVEALEQSGKRRPVRAGAGGGGPVEVDPRVAREFVLGDVTGEERMVAPGDDSGGHVEEAFAPQEVRQGRIVVDAPTVEVAVAGVEAAQALGAGRGVDPELDVGVALVEARRGLREDGLGPGHGRRDAEDAGAPGAGGVDRLLGGLDLAQDAARAFGHHGAERGEAHAGRQALEQAAREAVLEPRDIAGERRLGDVGALGRGARACPSRRRQGI